MIFSTLSERKDQVLTIVISSIGSTIFASAILHILYTQLIPLTALTAALYLFFPSVFIGIINEDIKESTIAMALTAIGTIFLIAVTRSIPALLGVFPNQADLFIFQQITESVPIFFLMIPIFLIGTMIGVVINEFVLKVHYESS